MKTKIKSILGSAFFALLLVFASSCSSDGKSRSLPSSTGTLHEVLVVSTIDTFSTSEIGIKMKGLFEVEMLGLMNSEKDFIVADVNEKSFNSILQKHSKIILINGNDLTVNKPTYEVMRNKWAKEQYVIRLNAANEKDLLALWENKGAEIKAQFHEFEMQREAIRNRSKANANFGKVIHENFGVKMSIPKRFRLATQKDNFLWFRSETPSTSEGIMIYKEPYTHDSTFTYDYIVGKRNKFTKENIPGPSEGSYMIVNPIFPKTQKEVNMDGAYAMETRGLWKLENDYMGGSFLSYTVYNEKTQEIITLEAFIFAPNNDKRAYMLDFEGILRTMRFE